MFQPTSYACGATNSHQVILHLVTLRHSETTPITNWHNSGGEWTKKKPHFAKGGIYFLYSIFFHSPLLRQFFISFRCSQFSPSRYPCSLMLCCYSLFRHVFFYHFSAKQCDLYFFLLVNSTYYARGNTGKKTGNSTLFSWCVGSKNRGDERGSRDKKYKKKKHQTKEENW